MIRKRNIHRIIRDYEDEDYSHQQNLKKKSNSNTNSKEIKKKNYFEEEEEYIPSCLAEFISSDDDLDVHFKNEDDKQSDNNQKSDNEFNNIEEKYKIDKNYLHLLDSFIEMCENLMKNDYKTIYEALENKKYRFISKIRDTSIIPSLHLGISNQQSYLEKNIRLHILWITKDTGTIDDICNACYLNRTLSYVMSTYKGEEEKEDKYIINEGSSDQSELQKYKINYKTKIPHKNNNNNTIETKNELSILSKITTKNDQKPQCSHCKKNICTKSMFSINHTCCLCDCRLKGLIIVPCNTCKNCKEILDEYTLYGNKIGNVCASKIATVIGFYEQLRKLISWINKNKKNTHASDSELMEIYYNIIRSVKKIDDNLQKKYEQYNN